MEAKNEVTPAILMALCSDTRYIRKTWMFWLRGHLPNMNSRANDLVIARCDVSHGQELCENTLDPMYA